MTLNLSPYDRETLDLLGDGSESIYVQELVNRVRAVIRERDEALAERDAAMAARNNAQSSAEAWWSKYDKLLSAVREIRDIAQREHDLGRIALSGYVRLLTAALDGSGVTEK